MSCERICGCKMALILSIMIVELAKKPFALFFKDVKYVYHSLRFVWLTWLVFTHIMPTWGIFRKTIAKYTNMGSYIPTRRDIKILITKRIFNCYWREFFPDSDAAECAALLTNPKLDNFLKKIKVYCTYCCTLRQCCKSFMHRSLSSI